MSNPKAAEIWLVRFPFSDLSTTKLRPALVLAVHREEQIILGIFSKIPPGEWWETSVIRTDKIATVNQSVFQQKLGILPSDILNQVQTALKKSLNIP
jgi:mRNA-degrading endonuclease toxin of MazEF toxin-antitoxin module